MREPREASRRTMLGIAAPEAGASPLDRMMPLVYDELKLLARAYFRNASSPHTLQPTALVIELYLKLAKLEQFKFQDKSHFMAVAATAMRHILVDHIRQKKRGKRWGNFLRVELTDLPAGFVQNLEDILALDVLLDKLAAKDHRKAKIIELRLFGGFSVEEVAKLLGTSKSTVEQEWTFIRALLRREFSSEPK
jgi:RNA polymerase sigma-70 factor (ECF subfamily)